MTEMKKRISPEDIEVISTLETDEHIFVSVENRAATHDEDQILMSMPLESPKDIKRVFEAMFFSLKEYHKWTQIQITALQEKIKRSMQGVRNKT
jgi:hypothetical protein